MPLYEYECEACGHRFEAIQKFSDAPLTTCPKCGGAVHKLIASPAFQFKGTGWYITDYAKKDSGAKAAGGEKAESPKSEAKTDAAKSESAKSDSTSSTSSDSSGKTKPAAKD